MSGIKRGRQQMMEDILNEHYDESYKRRRSSYQRRSKCSVACDMCNFTADAMNKLETHIQVHMTTKELEYEFFVPDSTLTPCMLLSSRSSLKKKTYYKKNIFKRVSWNSLPSIQLEHIFPSEQLLLFIPQTVVDKMPDIKGWVNLVVPYKELKMNIFAVEFPNLVETVLFAEDVDETLKSISEEKMVMFSEIRFESIQQVIPLNRYGLPQARFCEYLISSGHVHYLKDLDTRVFSSTAEKIHLKTQVIDEKSKLLNKNGVEVYMCPMANCNFVSPKKFTGIRVHLTKHFRNQIRLNAQNKTDVEILMEKVPSCLAKWVCSIENLEAEGDLVHHYGVLHCLVDRFFKAYVSKRLHGKMCLYDGLNFLNEDDFAEHLTVDHYFNLIFGEVEDKVYFKESELSVEYKCPFCNRMFQNSPGSDARDIRDLVKHCGLDHGFTFYHVEDQIKQKTKKTRFKNGADVDVEIIDLDKEDIEKDTSDYSIKVETSGCIKIQDHVDTKQQQGEVERHQRYRNGGDKYFCDKCKFKTKWKSHLNLHLVDHTQSVFKCDACDFVDDRFSRLKYHQVSQKHQS